MDNLSYIATWPHALCGKEGHFKKIAKEKKVGIAWLAGTILLLAWNTINAIESITINSSSYSALFSNIVMNWALQSLVVIAVTFLVAKTAAAITEKKGDWRNELSLIAPSIYMTLLYVMVLGGILDYTLFATHYAYGSAISAANMLVAVSAICMLAKAIYSRFKAGGAKNSEAISYAAVVLAALGLTVVATFLVLLLANGILSPAPLFAAD